MTTNSADPFCPIHDINLLPHKFERWETNPPVDGFRCPNLSCWIVYIEGNAEGFYTLESNGELNPYLKP